MSWSSTGAGARSPRHRTPAADRTIHDSLRSRGHAIPFAPARRPAWTADQEVRREEPAVGPRSYIAARLAPSWNCCCQKARMRAHAARPRISTCARGPAPAAVRDVLRHVRRPPVRRGRDAAPRRTAGSTLLDRETGEELAAAESDRGAARFFDDDLPERARERLADVIEMRALTAGRPGARRAPRLAVLNEDAKTVVRLTVESTRAAHARTAVDAATTAELDAGARDARAAGGDASRSSTRRSLAAGGARRARAPSSTLKLDPDEPADEAAATVFARLLEVIDDNLPGTLDDIDSEFLHDLRVAVRRTRSLQRQFKARLPRAPAALPRRVQAPAGRSPATCATSTSTCSTSPTCRPRCRRRCAPTWTRCAACSRPPRDAR